MDVRFQGMAQLKSYTCSKCGGALIVDKDQEVFDCPFCGTKFGFDDFHGQDVLGDGVKALRQMEFSSAKEKFERILKDDPSNFKALRGLVFCAGHINSPQYIQRIDKLRKCDINKMREAIPDAAEKAPENNKAYFSTLSSMLDLYDEYSEVSKESADLRNRQSSEVQSLTDLMDKKDTVAGAMSKGTDKAVDMMGKFKNETDDNTNMLAMFAVILVFVVAIIVCIYYLGPLGLFAAFGIAVLAFLIRGAILALIEHKKKPHREALKEIHSDLSEHSQKEIELSRKYDELYLRLRDLDPTLKKEPDAKESK